MFEKDAIRHAFEETIGVECLVKPVEDFTYEELSDDQQEKAYDFQKGAEFGYNKANEWHKVLDGDLPKHNNEVLCLLWGGTKEIGYYKNELWYFEDFTADSDDVDYWQEIKLPKEVKENEL